MIRAELIVLAIALVAVVACAQAQTQTASPESTIWDHNGSVMYLIANGPSREFHYQKPRAGMLEVGVRPSSLLFSGEIDNGQYSGSAYIFNPHCGQIPFQVKGSVLDNDERILLTGQAPRVGRNCEPHGSYTSHLEFRRLKPTEAAPSEKLLTVAPAPTMEKSKPELPSTDGGELPSTSTAQPSPRTNGTSQSASVYVAGKGKYCKQNAVRGYLDCFYASLDACEKYNKSPDLRCIPNPNSGT
jgi:hypothetical protein